MPHERLFPPDNPVWCKEKNYVVPYYEMECCDKDFCNTKSNLTLSIIPGERKYKKKDLKKNHPNLRNLKQKKNYKEIIICYVLSHSVIVLSYKYTGDIYI